MIDVMTGKDSRRLGRKPIPIVGRFCAKGCGHNHLAKYRLEGGVNVIYGTSSICASCDCEKFRG